MNKAQAHQLANRLCELANDKRAMRSPIVGIPVVLDSGQRYCVKVRRDLLQAALVNAQMAYWSESENRLVLEGGKRSCWRLISMDRASVLLRLSTWSNQQHQKQRQKGMTATARKMAKVEKVDKEIAVLRRKREKVGAIIFPIDAQIANLEEFKRAIQESNVPMG